MELTSEQIREIVTLVGQLWLAEKGQPFKDRHVQVLSQVLSGRRTYLEISEDIHGTESSIKQSGYEIFRFLKIHLSPDIKKSNCRNVLSKALPKLKSLVVERLEKKGEPISPAQKFENDIRYQSGNSDSHLAKEINYELPGTTDQLRLVATDLPIGRDMELAKLQSEISANPNSLVLLSGLPKSGQKSLALALSKSLNHIFGDPIFFDAKDIRTLRDFLYRIAAKTASNEEDALIELMAFFIRERKLVIVNNFEYLFAFNTLAGTFKSASQSYNQFLNRILSEESLKSCLLLVTTSFPVILSDRRYNQYGASASRLIHESLDGWSAEFTHTWLTEHSHWSSKSRNDSQLLWHFCGGHPAWLDAAVAAIVNMRCDVLAYLNMPDSLLRGVDALLNKQLTDAEKAILPWLLHYPLSYQNVGELWILGFKSVDLRDALNSLVRRGFVRPNGNESDTYVFHSPIVRRSAANLWHHKLLSELMSENLEWMHRYPLLLVDGSERSLQQQKDEVIAPLIDALTRSIDHREKQRICIGRAVDKIRSLNLDPVEPGRGDYAIGNLINIAVALNLPLEYFNISNTRLHHADLRSAKLSNWVAQSSQFLKVLYPLPLCPALQSAISPDGKYIVLGNAKGQLFCWEKSESTFTFRDYYEFYSSITAISVTGNLVAIAHDRAIQLFTINDVQDIDASRSDLEKPQKLSIGGESLAKITCLAFDTCKNYLAVGLSDGYLEILDLRRNLSIWREQFHGRSITKLAFNTSSTQIAILVEHSELFYSRIDSESSQFNPTLVQQEYSFLFTDFCWDNDQLSSIQYGVETGEILYKRSETLWTLANDSRTAITTFSGDGKTIAWFDCRENSVNLHRLKNGVRTSVELTLSNNQSPHFMQLDNEGKYLLLCNDTQIEVWEILNTQLLWKREYSLLENSVEGCDFTDAQGMPYRLKEIFQYMGITLTHS